MRKKMFSNLQFSITFLLTIVFVDLLHVAPLKALSIDFTRELIENDKTEHTRGTLHYDAADSRVVVEVKAPLKQIMVMQDKVLEIYYPVENRMFRFIAKVRIPLPFAVTRFTTFPLIYPLWIFPRSAIITR